jgi:hypothetical protein
LEGGEGERGASFVEYLKGYRTLKRERMGSEEFMAGILFQGLFHTTT